MPRSSLSDGAHVAGEDKRRVLRRPAQPHLFRPIRFRTVEIKNRIMMSPMCQYSSTDGVANDWHFAHLASRAAGGAGIVCVEATHVEARGRITPHCMGLWNDAQRDALARIAAFVAELGAVPAIQLAHAGRKASTARPWEGSGPLAPDEGGWEVLGPTATPYADGYPTTKAMDDDDVATVVAAFGTAAHRAREAGFRILELHAAHGYLLHSFLSPLSNTRSDGYGGDVDGRARLLFEVIDAIRHEWPADNPLFIRISASDWVEGGWDLDQSIDLAKRLRDRGDVDLIDCSSGGNDRRQKIPVHPGYQVPFADAIRRETGMATGAVGLIHSPDMAETIIANEQADLVVLGRSLLHDPYWPLHAAAALKAGGVPWPVQYERGNIF